MNPLKPILIGLTGVGLLFFGLSFGNEGLEPYRWFCLLLAVVALSFAPNSRLIRAAFGIATLATIVFFATQFISKTSVGTKNIDLTEDNRYTLTDGTRAILSELTEPVTINYYVTRDVDGTPAHFKRHIPRVDNFLREIENLAENDLITLNFVDPEPNTDEEDAALLDQVQQIDVTQDDKMIFGASISSLDKKTVIPVFDPDQETQLEFQIISAIAEVTTRNAPVVGLMSAHNMAMGGQSQRGWLFHQVLKRSYDLIDLGMMPTASLEDAYEDRKWGEAPDYLDPEKIPLMLVIHPAGITPGAEFSLDQYILRGGTVIACVDPMSMVAQQSGRSQIPGMPPQGGTPPSSTLPAIFKKHNIEFSGSQVMIDRAYATKQNPGVLLLNKEAMPIEDDISLSSIQNLALLFSGGFSGANGKPIGTGVESSRLVESSYQYTFVDGQTMTSREGAEQLRFALGSRREDDEKQAFVTLLSGTFETAFPDGDPATKEEEDTKEGEKNEEVKPKSSGLATGTARGNLYLIADSDFLYDGMAYQFQRFGNSGFMQTVSGNGPFVLNIIDQAVGSKYLIGARARTPVYRNFTVLKDKEAELEKVAGERIKEFEAKAAEAAQEMQKIRSQLTQNNSAQLTPEYQAQITEYRKAEVDARKAIRKEQKSYQSEIDALKAGVFWKSILIVPLIVIIIGLAVFFWRRAQTNAR
ncbi:MAG: GldG family protein [Akkermansiaceae bacterium]|nr:GldG family protein [Akkermansiaceae bacterium]